MDGIAAQPKQSKVKPNDASLRSKICCEKLKEVPSLPEAVVAAAVGPHEAGEVADGLGFVAVDDGEALVAVVALEAAEVSVEGLVGAVVVAALGVDGQREERPRGAVEERGALLRVRAGYSASKQPNVASASITWARTADQVPVPGADGSTPEKSIFGSCVASVPILAVPTELLC